MCVFSRTIYYNNIIIIFFCNYTCILKEMFDLEQIFMSKPFREMSVFLPTEGMNPDPY